MDMAELGAANYARTVSLTNDSISQRSAFKEFGEARIRRWLKSGLVNKIRSGSSSRSKIIYSRAELMAADKSEKLNNLINKQL